jgi:two-component system cell cycle response regulator
MPNRYSILIVEDTPTHQDLIIRILARDQPYADVHVASTGNEALHALSERRFDCALLDFNLPDYCADDLMAEASDLLEDTPTLVVSANREQSAVIASLRRGVVDFIPKADITTPGLLWQRIETAINMNRETRADRRRRERRERRLARLVDTDHMTQLFNRRYFHRYVDCDDFVRDRRQGVAIVMIDIDHFKSINDEQGHAKGDAALCAAANIIQRCAAGADRAFRWGGEEFLALRPSCSTAVAWLWAEQVRREIENRVHLQASLPLPVTASIGIASATTNANVLELVNRADHALYLAKERGRNRVCTWSMVLAERLADDAQLVAGSTVEDRREDLLQRHRDLLGPTQRNYTIHHCQHVRHLTDELADRLGLDPADRQTAGDAALLHDIGKLVIPEDILALPRPLTAEEHTIMGRHTGESLHLSQRLGADPRVNRTIAALGRHDAPTADRAPAPVDIVNVADAYAAMTMQRPHAEARSHDDAMAELRIGRGTQFHADVVDAASTTLAAAA